MSRTIEWSAMQSSTVREQEASMDLDDDSRDYVPPHGGIEVVTYNVLCNVQCACMTRHHCLPCISTAAGKPRRAVLGTVHMVWL